MQWSRALLSAGLLMGAAAHAQEQPARPLPAATEPAAGQVIQTLVEQPVLDDEEVPHRIIGEVRPDGEKFLVRVANMGRDAELSAVTWDVGQYTGFRPAAEDQLGRFQRGPAQSVQGSAVQMRRDEIGIWIDSDHPRPRAGSLIPVCPAYWWWDVKTAPRPFADPQHELTMAFDMQVPTADRVGDGRGLCVCVLSASR